MEAPYTPVRNPPLVYHKSIGVDILIGMDQGLRGSLTVLSMLPLAVTLRKRFFVVELLVGMLPHMAGTTDRWLRAGLALVRPPPSFRRHPFSPFQLAFWGCVA